MTSTALSPQRVLVAGGGVAALEAVLALRALADERVTIELLAPDRHFTYRPLAVTELFSPVQTRRFPLADIGADRHVLIRRDALAKVRRDDCVVETQGGVELGYDSLVLALGARMTEGVRGALTFRGEQDALRVRAVLDALRVGTIRHVAFVVPTGTAWALPIYELALQTAAFLRGSAPAARLSVVTAEQIPLAIFGEATSTIVRRLLAESGISLRTGTHVNEFVDGELWMSEQSQTVDRVIALPLLTGPRPRGVPCDPLGFLPVDDFMRVVDAEGVYAIGDSAAQGIKQGGLATQQADVAATAIAAAAGAPVNPRPFRPVLRGRLLTGDEAHVLRHDPRGAEVADEQLSYPAANIAGRYLAPYLASHLELGLPPAAQPAPVLQPLT